MTKLACEGWVNTRPRCSRQRSSVATKNSLSRQTSHSHPVATKFFSRHDREFQDMGFPMLRQWHAHGRVSVPMLDTHGKQMRTTKSSAGDDKARVRGNNALGTCTTWRCECNRRTWARAIEAFCHDRPVQ